MADRNGLRLKLIGRLRLVDPRDREVVVPSAKAQGLLALLATASEFRRQRSFVQDKLWSESEPEKGAASLRQLLTVTRRALGPWRDVLISAPGWVALDPEVVSVDLLPDAADWGFGDDPPEFAAGLDIRDPEFEDWLRDQRMAAEDRLADLCPPALPAAAASPPASAAVQPWITVVVSPPVSTEPDLQPLADMVAGDIAAHLRDEGGVSVLFGAGESPAARLAVRAARVGDGIVLQAAWHDGQSDALLSCGRRSFARGRRGSSAVLDELVAEATVSGLLALSRKAPAGSTLPVAQITGAVVGDADALAAADRLLARLEGLGGGLVPAYRAQLRVIAEMERFGPVFGATTEEAVALTRRARAADPVSASVKAIAAEVALLLEQSPAKAAALADEARRQAPANALARINHARALAFLSREREAHAEAKQAVRLATGHPRMASFHTFSAVTAMLCGFLDEAETHAAMAHDLAPSFRPPLRYLAALRWHRRDEAGTVAALRALKAAEPDFELAMMADPAYPVASLRAAGLTGVARSGLL